MGWIAESWDWNVWKSAIETSFPCLEDDSFSISRIFLRRLVQEGCPRMKTYLALLTDKERKTLPKVIWLRLVWKYQEKTWSCRARFKPKFIERLKDSLGVAKSLSSWLKDRTSAIEKGWFLTYCNQLRNRS